MTSKEAGFSARETVFAPSEVNAELRLRLNQLMDKAPSDSSGVLFVRRCHEGFKGILKIRSRACRFVAGGVAASLSELMDRVDREIGGQLAVWRQTRFEGP